jgi:hypothetical protein
MPSFLGLQGRFVICPEFCRLHAVTLFGCECLISHYRPQRRVLDHYPTTGAWGPRPPRAFGPEPFANRTQFSTNTCIAFLLATVEAQSERPMDKPTGAAFYTARTEALFSFGNPALILPDEI